MLANRRVGKGPCRTASGEEGSPPRSQLLEELRRARA
jgi:hypothetical protein